MKVKFKQSLADWKAGETYDLDLSQVNWLVVKGIAEHVKEEPKAAEAPKPSPVMQDLDALFAEEKPKAKIKPTTKAMKAPENKSEG